MPDPLIYHNGYSRAPKTLNGAFVQLIEDVVGFLPNVVTFQYFPTTLSYTLEPWDPTAVDQGDRGNQAPTAQPFDVPQSFSGFELMLDATDGMAVDHPVYNQFGVEPQIAALKKMTQASQGLLGDLTASFKDLIGLAGQQAQRPTVAPVFLVLGARIILPVRFTSFSVEESLLSPTLQPLIAKVTVDMAVMTPDMFRCQNSPTAKIAIAAYEATRLHEDAAAVLNLANLPGAFTTIVPL
jgi:hypothetical protein